MTRFSLVIVSAILSTFARGQDARVIDSLMLLMDTTKVDTVQLGVVDDLYWQLYLTPEEPMLVRQLGRIADSLMRHTHPLMVRQGQCAKVLEMNALGYKSISRNDQLSALRHYRTGAQYAELSGDHFSIGLIDHNLARLFRSVGDTARTLRTVAHLIHHMKLAADTSSVMTGWAMAGLYRPDTIGLRAVMDSMLAMGPGLLPAEVGIMETHHALLLERLGEKRAMMEALHKAVKALEEHGDVNFQYSTTLRYLGERLAAADSLKEAMKVNERCIAYSKEQRQWGDYCDCLGSSAALAERIGDHKSAERSWRELLRVAEHEGLTSSAHRAAGALRTIYREQGRLAESMAMTDRWLELSDTIRERNAQQQLMAIAFEEQMAADSTEAARILEQDRDRSEARLAKERTRRNIVLGIGFGLLVFGLVLYRQRDRIRKEHARSERLLLNILPGEVATELKAKGHADARHFEQASILFTDFKGFTAMSENVTPAQLVKDLHECFSAFDVICERYGIEKIKTIGDAYMAAGGLPVPNTTHAVDTIHAALEMRDFTAQCKVRKLEAGLPFFEIRIGVHTGPVVAGIVGTKKFQYDIWGDTVNTASRMESSGAVGEVNISEATYALVKDDPGLRFTSRGRVQAKGKGELEMFFVAMA